MLAATQSEAMLCSILLLLLSLYMFFFSNWPHWIGSNKEIPMSMCICVCKRRANFCWLWVADFQGITIQIRVFRTNSVFLDMIANARCEYYMPWFLVRDVLKYSFLFASTRILFDCVSFLLLLLFHFGSFGWSCTHYCHFAGFTFPKSCSWFLLSFSPFQLTV